MVLKLLALFPARMRTTATKTVNSAIKPKIANKLYSGIVSSGPVVDVGLVDADGELVGAGDAEGEGVAE